MERIVANQALIKSYETQLHEKAVNIDKLQKEYNDLLRKKASLLSQIINDSQGLN